jgi:hypothetical protein
MQMEDLPHAVISQNVARIRELLAGGADPNGWVIEHALFSISYLSDASYAGRVDIAEMLLDARADIELDCPGSDFSRPLQCAVSAGHYECAKMLLKRGARVDSQHEWDIPLVLAYDLRMIQLLCAHNSSRRLISLYLSDPKNQQWPLGEVSPYDETEVLRWLEDSDSWSSQLHYLEFLDADEVQALLQHNDVFAGCPSALEIAWRVLERDADHISARLVVTAAGYWSEAKDHLFPDKARTRAKELRKLGAQLAADDWTLMDVWVTHIIPLCIQAGPGKNCPGRIPRENIVPILKFTGNY